MTPDTSTALPTEFRQLTSPAAGELTNLLSIFQDLQTVLSCCERLVADLGAAEPDPVAIEGSWSVALLSYARCFAGRRNALSPDDLKASQPHGDVLGWHRVLLKLRDHYADPVTNPRERFSVGVSFDHRGAAAGIGVTSVQQPQVDLLTVRQLGAIAFELSTLVDARVTAQQQKVFAEVKDTAPDELSKLARIEVAPPA
jgi:hypothetical protein